MIDVAVEEESGAFGHSLTPRWGKMTYLDYKYRMEFNEEQLKELFDFAKVKPESVTRRGEGRVET